MTPTESLNPEDFLPRFGLQSFRPGQREIIQSIVDGHDCLCIMPTGGGKSLCYQLPSIARPGVTLVVSPLIALMKDQVDGLLARGIPAACLNSTQTVDEQSQSLRDMVHGKLELVYVAPERLRSLRFLEAIERTDIQLLAIDEAHCISQWGHDFRPDYARLGKLRQRIGNPQTVALTATATDDVQQDISRQLHLNEPETFVKGFARDNLSLQVRHPGSIAEKNQQLNDFLDSHPGSGIIYVSTRKKCEEIASSLHDRNRSFGFYHGGMLPEKREQTQNEFMDGKLDVIIATNAFGMGIDKPDIRFVVHYNIPGTLEAFYQEAGRAGRDGKPSDCLLLFSNGDRFIQEFFIENAYPSRGAVKKVYEFLRTFEQDPIEITLGDLKEAVGLEIANEGIAVCEQLLEQSGALERLATTQNLASVRLIGKVNSFVDLVPREQKSQRKILQKIERLIGDNRDERYFFHPRQLVDSKFSLEKIQRAIRQLSELSFFDYVAPFRGRAVHLTDRNRPFSTWSLDFTEIERRKELELQKLQTMIDFANSRQCRQLEILRYFGDTDLQPCGSCDNCKIGSSQPGQSSSGRIAAKYLPGVYHCVRIVLSGVARGRGRFGKSLIGQMLRGSNSARLRKTGMHQLSTFGLLDFLSQSEIETIIDAAISCQMVRQEEKTRFRPVVEITELGKQVMGGKNSLPEHFTIGDSLVRKTGIYFRDSDATVGESTTVSNEFTECKGPVPEVGADLAEPVQERVSIQASIDARESIDAKESIETKENEQPIDWRWTLRLLDQGYSIPEVLEIRRMDYLELFDQLDQAIKAMELTDTCLVFSNEECVQLDSVETPELNFDWLPPEYTQNAVNLYKKIRRIA